MVVKLQTLLGISTRLLLTQYNRKYILTTGTVTLMQFTPSNKIGHQIQPQLRLLIGNIHGPVYQGVQCGRVDIRRRQLRQLTIHTNFYRSFLKVFSKMLH